MKKKKHAEHVNHERWLVSYADFITLLFAFFVVMYASSQVDQKKAGRLSHAIETAFKELGVFDVSAVRPPITDAGGAAPAPAASEHPADSPEADLVSELRQALSEELANQSITIESGGEGTVISLREVGLFPTASVAMKPEAVDALRRIAKALKKSNLALRIEGHTDDVPIHNAEFASNWELSSERAVAVLEKLEEDGVSGKRMSAVGYAEFRPVLPNNSDSHRAVNRRIDLVVLHRFPSLKDYAPAAEGDKSLGVISAGKP